MIREVNNTFKNLLRAKGCQSIYKHMVGAGDTSRCWGWDSTQAPSQAWTLLPATTVPLAIAWNSGSTGGLEALLRSWVEDPLVNLWPCLPQKGLPTSHRPAQRGLWEAPKDRGQCRGHRGWDTDPGLPRVEQTCMYTHTRTCACACTHTHLHRIARGFFCVNFFVF